MLRKYREKQQRRKISSRTVASEFLGMESAPGRDYPIITDHDLADRFYTSTAHMLRVLRRNSEYTNWLVQIEEDQTEEGDAITYWTHMKKMDPEEILDCVWSRQFTGISMARARNFLKKEDHFRKMRYSHFQREWQ